ncbi:MAG: hypothetical protein AAFV07_02035 [Bacteroidota bacterium]
MTKRYRTYLILLLGGVSLAVGGVWWQPWLQAESLPFIRVQVPSPTYDSALFASNAPSLETDPYARYLPAPKLDLAQFEHPDRVFAPWISWPILGSQRSDVSLVRELQGFYEAGLGGMLLQNAPDFDGNHLRYFHQLKLLSREAEKHQMQVDWMLSPKSEEPVQGARTLSFGEAYVRGGKMVHLPLPIPRKDFAFHARQSKKSTPPLADTTCLDLLAVYALQTRNTERTEFFWDLLDQSFFDPDSVFLISQGVDSAGLLHWQAPEGYWWVLAVYVKPVPKEAPGLTYPGWLDPLDSLRIIQALNDRIDSTTGIATHIGAGFRGIFRTPQQFASDRLYHPQLLDQLHEGGLTALHPYVPLLLGPGRDQLAIHQHQLATLPPFADTLYDGRLRDAYDQLRSTRILEQSVLPAQRWSLGWGLTDQLQLGTNGLSWIDAARQHPFPAIELGPGGGRTALLKLLTAGATLQDQKLLSGLVWPAHPIHLASNGQKLHMAAHKLFQQGVNHLTFPYQAWKAGSTSLKPISRVTWQKHNLAVSREQYLLRHGRPVTDVWVYYPFADFPVWSAADFSWSEFLMNGLDPGYDSALMAGKPDYPGPFTLKKETDPRAIWLNRLMPFLHELETAGYHWNWASASMLKEMESREDARWTLGETEASAVLLAFVPNWNQDLLALARNAGAGIAPLVWLGDIPEQSDNFWAAEASDNQTRMFASSVDPKYQFQAQSVFRDFLRRSPWTQRISFYGPTPFLSWQERVLPEGDRLFRFFNQTGTGRHGRFRLKTAHEQAYWLFPEEGRVVPVSPDGLQSGDLNLYLPGFSSQYLFLAESEAPDDSLLSTIPFRQADLRLGGSPLMELEKWDILIASRRAPMYALKDQELLDWRLDPVLRNTASEAVYTCSFAWADTSTGRHFILDLGEVYGEAEVWINKSQAGLHGYAPYRYDLTSGLQAGLNTLEIWLRPPRFNAWSHIMQETASYPDGTDWTGKRVSTGILGPVWLWSWESTPEPGAI